MKVTLDTNVLVRLATRDDDEQVAVALQALKNASLMAVPNTALCEMVWVLIKGYRYTPAQAAIAVRTLINVKQVVCNTPAALAGLALLESGGDFADGVIAHEGGLLGGQELITFDQQAAKLLKAQNHKVRLLNS
jgi:predicted nucleic-acid-binding protein